MMTCREIAEFLMAYLDGELAADQSAHFKEHLGECPDCVAYLSSYREVVRSSGAAYSEPMPTRCDDLPNDLVKTILAAHVSGKN